MKAKPVNELIDAVEKGNIIGVKNSIHKGISPNSVDEHGNSALMIACARNSKEIVQYIISTGAKVNKKNKNGRTALLNAIMSHSDIEIIKMLIDNGAKVNTKDKQGWEPLTEALSSYRGSVDALKLLITAGAKVNKKDNDGYTPLMHAVGNSMPEKVRILLNAGAKINTKDKYGNTVLTKITVLTPDPEDTIKILLEAGLKDINSRNKDGETALFVAASYAELFLVKALLKYGADPSIRDRHGRTVLYASTVNIPIALKENITKYKAITKILLNAGASDPDLILCISCFKQLEPFYFEGGMWTGTLMDLFQLPKMEDYHGFKCEKCGKIVCTVCSGKKAKKLGAKVFVCPNCSYAPLKTIYRRGT